MIKKHFNQPLIMTTENELDFQNSTTCYICEKEYSDKDKPVRDHCHITGKYRGSAHNSCNLQLRFDPDKIKIPYISLLQLMLSNFLTHFNL